VNTETHAGVAADAARTGAAALPASIVAAVAAWQGDAPAQLLELIAGLTAVVDAHVYVHELVPGGQRSIFDGPGLGELLGVKELAEGESVSGSLFRSCVHPHDQGTYEQVASSVDPQSGHAAAAEYRLVGVDGVTRWVSHSQRVRVSGGSLFVDGSVRDITAERDAIARLRAGEPATARERRRQHDPLTGAANTELLLQTISETAGELTVLYIDIDGFRELNDRYGPICGDDALRAVAERLRSVLRPGDLVARVGGDEFAAVCRTAPGSNSFVIIQRIAAAFMQPIDYGGITREISVSIGVAQRAADAEVGDPMDLVERAGQSMRHDRSRGRGY
jgi:diguanylate cyclase (GGDEF)-like protein